METFEANHPRSGYSVYNKKAVNKTKINMLEEVYPPLPASKFSIIYADPPWHYNGKLQFDKSGIASVNKNWQKDVFVSAAAFKYPTIKTSELKTLHVASIAKDDSLLFLWATNPHLQQAIELGTAWGFEYKTVAFVWNKMMHNPGQYTLSYCELCLLFKRGRIPQPRGARNVKQLIEAERTEHSQKPVEAVEGIELMFPDQKKIELFAREKRDGWNAWGLETVYNNAIVSKEDVSSAGQNDLLADTGL